ncbi:MAG TPA: outer membrane beta-barrel protein [Bradyrhizobium sp.]|jgi:outer membrane immunogenic protein
MKKIVLAAVAMVGFVGQSFAADLPARMPMKAAPMAPAAYNWNGFYLGANVGYGWDKISTDTFNSAGVFLENTKHDRSGVFGGGQIGYNWQFAPNWLLGIEADAEASDIKGSNAGCSATGCSSSNGKTDDFGTVRGRFGYVANNVLLYGTGGWAWSHSTTDRTVTCVVAGGGTCPGGPSPSPLTGMIASASGSESGWAAGAGIEWGFLPNWTAKVEYLHLQFDNVGRDFSYAGFPTAFRHVNSNSGLDTVRVGVNYLFNTGPIVARY